LWLITVERAMEYIKVLISLTMFLNYSSWSLTRRIIYLYLNKSRHIDLYLSSCNLIVFNCSVNIAVHREKCRKQPDIFRAVMNVKGRARFWACEFFFSFIPVNYQVLWFSFSMLYSFFSRQTFICMSGNFMSRKHVTKKIAFFINFC
jgi:hypothetical protein